MEEPEFWQIPSKQTHKELKGIFLTIYDGNTVTSSGNDVSHKLGQSSFRAPTEKGTKHCCGGVKSTQGGGGKLAFTWTLGVIIQFIVSMEEFVNAFMDTSVS